MLKNALHIVVFSGKINEVTSLCERGANINEIEQDWSLLQLGAYAGHVETCIELINFGASVNLGKSDGWTALHLASYNNQIKAIQLLASKGALVDQKTNNGETALHIAARNGNNEAISALIEKGANVNCKSTIGATPLYLATEKQKLTTIAILVKLGCNINIKNNNGISPVHLAAEKAFVNTVWMLLELGADHSGITGKARNLIDQVASRMETKNSEIKEVQPRISEKYDKEPSVITSPTIERQKSFSPEPVLPSLNSSGDWRKSYGSGRRPQNVALATGRKTEDNEPLLKELASAKEKIASLETEKEKLLKMNQYLIAERARTNQDDKALKQITELQEEVSKLKAEKERSSTIMKDIEQVRAIDYKRMKESLTIELQDLKKREEKIKSDGASITVKAAEKLAKDQARLSNSVVLAFTAKLKEMEATLQKLKNDKQKVMEELEKAKVEKDISASELQSLKASYEERIEK